MAVTITKIGDQIKVEQSATDIKYYPIDDITHEIKIDVIQLFLQGKIVHTFKFADFVSPTGADLEAIADLIAGLLGSTGGGGGGDASAANQVLEIAELQTIAAANLSAENTAFITTSVLAASATFTSPVLNAAGHSQVQTEILASHDGTIDIFFCADAGGVDVVRSLSIPYAASGGYQFFAAPAFANYIKYEFTNTAGVTQTDFYYTTKFLTVGLSPQLLTTGAFIAAAMVTSLGRNIIVGQDVTGNFNNVSVVETTNDAGTYHNLQVVNGARPSQLAGRSSVKIVSDVTAPALEYTVTSGKTLYITDILLTIENSDQTASGRLDIYDSLISPTSEPIILPINVAESTNSETIITTISHTFVEPVEFSAGVWFEETAGTLIMTGIINGYEE